MRDEDDGGAHVLLKFSDEVKHLLLHGDVKGSSGLVRNEDFRPGDKGHGDHDALAHAAGELMGIGVHALFSVRYAYQGKLFQRAVARLFFAGSLMNDEGFRHLLPDGQVRIEGGHGILEDHGDALAADGTEFLFRTMKQVRAVQHGGTAFNAARRHRDEPHHGVAGDGFSGPGFPHDAERFPRRHVKGHVSHRPDDAGPGVEGGAEVPDGEHAEKAGLSVIAHARAGGEDDRDAGSGVGFPDFVAQVLGVAVREQVLVIDEEDVARDGNGVVLGVHRRGDVVDFQSSGGAAGGAGRVHLLGKLDEAVELSGGGQVTGFPADARDDLEDDFHALRFFCGGGDEGRIVDEEEFPAHLFLHFRHAVLARGIRVEEVEFVHDDDAGFPFLRNDAGDTAVLLRDACRNVNDQQADVRPADGFFTAHGGEDFHGGVPPGARAHAGGVDQHVGLAVVQVGDVNGVAGGARHVGNDGALVLEDGVDQGGFARVGASNDGHLDVWYWPFC